MENLSSDLLAWYRQCVLCVSNNSIEFIHLIICSFVHSLNNLFILSFINSFIITHLFCVQINQNGHGPCIVCLSVSGRVLWDWELHQQCNLHEHDRNATRLWQQDLHCSGRGWLSICISGTGYRYSLCLISRSKRQVGVQLISLNRSMLPVSCVLICRQQVMFAESQTVHIWSSSYL